MAMRANGACSASLSNRMAVRSSPSSELLSGSSAASERSSATPPPATIPSSTAARVALSASSSLAFFSFSSTSVGAHLDHRHAPGQPRLPLLQLLAVEVGSGDVDLRLDLLHAVLDRLIAAGALDDGGVVLGGDDAAGAAQVGHLGLLQGAAQVLQDGGAAREDGDVFQHRLAAVTEAGRLHRQHVTVPRILLTTRVASASPSTSSLTITKFLLICSAFSSTGRMSLTAEIL